MKPPAQEYAAAAGYVLHDRGGRHLVVLLHGLGGDRNQPLGLVPDHLAGVGISVLAADARAHGETDLTGEPERFSTPNLAADVLALIDRLGLTDRTLIPVGISMGAAVGLDLLQDQRDRVAGGVLIRPSFGPQPWPEHLRVFRSIAALLRAQGPAGVVDFTASAEYLAVKDISVSAAKSLAEQFTKPRAAQRVVRLETVPANTAVDWAVPLDIGNPVTVVAARRDPGHPEAVAELWHHQLSGSHLVTVPSRDHEPATYASQLEQLIVNTIATLTQKGPRPS